MVSHRPGRRCATAIARPIICCADQQRGRYRVGQTGRSIQVGEFGKGLDGTDGLAICDRVAPADPFRQLGAGPFARLVEG